jgi:hypothetical protein
VWPYNTDVLSPDAVKTIIDVGIASELLEPSTRDLTYKDIVDTRPMDKAMELLGGPVDPSDIKQGKVPEPKGS